MSRHRNPCEVCEDITGVRATVNEQYNSKKPVYFRSVNTMGFAYSAHTLGAVHEVQNEQHNKITLGIFLGGIDGHAQDRDSACVKALWDRGR